MDKRTTSTVITSWQGTTSTQINEQLAREAPLDIRVLSGEKGAVEQRLAVTLRTPGDDVALSLGYLFSEGIVVSAADCSAEQLKDDLVRITLQPWIDYSGRQLARGSFIHSGCGLCGKTFIEAMHTLTSASVAITPISFQPNWLNIFDAAMNDKQTLFRQTGGSHAAAFFRPDGTLGYLGEDIGRHNALDKAIGQAMLAGEKTHGMVVWISARAGFELVQKAIMAGAGMLVAVGPPSSLGVELAEEFGLTLVAFARNGKANVYHQASPARK